MNIFSSTISHIEQGIDYASNKQKVTSHNIANVETPGYKAKNVSFKETLKSEMKRFEAYRTQEKHIPFSSLDHSNSFNVYTRNDASYMSNGNSVDIDQEMAEMAQNQIYYDALVDRLSGKFNSLKTVIKGGRA
ncbi:flagellar basal body rod protein FlgB [Bacillus sp. FJAT-47783]|uniref:flagellar basal body rod protein FlgB n=1 Tax=Bacillus sp. FJAT-47783 TaxID=2922712 RepID=UPI001FAB3C98|nr:flagellar basal body rod protein FlgB [Bacillus sp. FJAT-47783]